jgi:hypothetical protein
MVQGTINQRKRARKATSQERVRRNSRRRIRSKRIHQIVQSRLEDGEKASAHKHEAYARHDPVDIRGSRPSHDELTRGKENRAEHHRRESLFGHGAVSCRMVCFIVQRLVVRVSGSAEDSADQDGEEGQRSNELGPAPNLAEDDGDAAELHVQDAVAETRIERHEEADGGAEQLDGAEEELARHFDEGDVPFFEPGVQRPVPGFVAQTPRFLHEEELWVAFVDED